MRNKIRDALRTLILATLLGLGIGALAFQVAGAAADEPPPPATGTEVESTLINIPASTTTYLIAVIIPIVGGLIMRFVTSQNGRVAVMLVLNGLNALITTATTEGGNAILSAPLVNNFIISTVISLATLFGFYKKVEVGGSTIDAKLKGGAA